MKQYLRICAIILALCAVFALCVSAESGAYVVDDADLLTDTQEDALRATLETVGARRDCDIVVVTINDLEGKSAEAYADAFYDYGGYADDGILLLVCMTTREYPISTSGSCVYDVTELAFDEMENAFVPYLKTGDFLDAFTAFANTCDRVLDPSFADEYEDVYNDDYYGEDSEPMALSSGILVALLVGFIIALCVTMSMRNKLISVRTQPAANQYIRADSMSMTQAYDRFLYRNVTRVARSKDTSSSGGSHRSSSGRSHGGRSGRF